MNVAEAMPAGNIPALIPTLVMYTGDEKWLRAPYAPARQKGLDDNHDGGLGPRSRPRSARPRPRPSRTATYVCHARRTRSSCEMLSVAMGEAVPPEYGPMIAAELGLGTPPPAPEAGAGRLPGDHRRRGRLGPGDVDQAGRGRHPAHRARAQPDRRRHLAREPLSRAPASTRRARCTRSRSRRATGRCTSRCATSCTPTWSSSPTIRRARADPLRHRGDGPTTTRTRRNGSCTTAAGELRANVVITAVGGFNKPKWPASDLSAFDGPVVHTARWPDDLSLAGQRVGVIGNGASAMQLVPAVCERRRT